jgi:hypothetical protein
MQHCGCNSDIVKDEIHERASVLPYVYIDISNQPPRVHASTLVIRMQDIVFPSDINFQGILARIVSAASTSDWSIHTCTVHPRKLLIYYLVPSIAITKTVLRRRDIALLSANVRVLRYGALLVTSI